MLYIILINEYEMSQLRIKTIDVFRNSKKNKSYVTLYQCQVHNITTKLCKNL